MAEPLGQSGVERIRTSLEVNGNALITFQDDVVAQLRSFAARAGLRHVRLVAPRPQVKTWSSVVDKINRRRRLQKASERRYQFSDVNDLVGAKVLCAYLSDVTAVLDWLFRQRSFRVTPTR